mmetsp:Transcript_36626/g.82815  ORF Transcript_36626/g.82815 Transcript_36626/m.82815 type:complete len:297 (-) Transcript_36626:51-941(-)
MGDNAALKKLLSPWIDIDTEFQGWILLFASITCVWLFCLPCYCAGLQCSCARRFAVWVQQRLPNFYLFITLLNCSFMFLIITWLPDWTPLDYVQTLLKLAGWLAGHLLKFATSLVMIVAFAFAVAFKDRIALILGIDHKTLFKCKVRDCLYCWSTSRFQPIEMHLWKVEDLASADIFSANNIFIELFFGYNETMSTRVHNNAGSGCIFKETLQLNFDEDDEEETLFIFVRNQKVMGAQELARAEIPTSKLKKMIHATKDNLLRWERESFGDPITLIPRGRLWMRAVPIVDEEMPTC